MQKLVLVVLTTLAMFLGACGGPVDPTGKTGPDGNKQVHVGAKSFPVVYEGDANTPLVLWNGNNLLVNNVLIKAGEKKAVVLKEPQPEFKLRFGAAFAGYIHPKELQAGATVLSIKSGSTTVLTGDSIPWLFPFRRYMSDGSVQGHLIPVNSLDTLRWEDGKVVSNGDDLLLDGQKGQPNLYTAGSASTQIYVQFRWDGKKFVASSKNLLQVSARYLRRSQVPRAFTELFKNKPQDVQGQYRNISSDSTWEVTLEGTDKQGRPFKKSYYALVAKPY